MNDTTEVSYGRNATTESQNAEDWYGVVAKPGAALAVAERLKFAGVSVYLPLCRVQVSHARKVEQVVKPLFGRYVFVAPGAKPFSILRYTPGVAFVVSNRAGCPCRIRESALAAVRERCGTDGVLDLTPQAKPRLRWAIGTELRVTEGPLKDLVAIFEGVAGKDAAQVLVELFGRPIVTTVPIDSLKEGAF